MIHIYSRPNCAPCVQVKRYLNNKGIPYSLHEAEGERYEELSVIYGYTVPLVYNDELGRGMVGYDLMILKYVLGENHEP